VDIYNIHHNQPPFLFVRPFPAQTTQEKAISELAAVQLRKLGKAGL